MKILIVSSGDIGDEDTVRNSIPSFDYVICVDGGTRHARGLNIVPDLIIGDFDSIPAEILDEYTNMGIPIKKYPVSKDETDTQIAVDIAVQMGADSVTLIGAIGSRWDHSYANIMLLCRLTNKNINATILHSHNIITVSKDALLIEGKVGDVVSLLPLGENTYILSTEGLKYPIFDKKLPLDFPYGVSNVLTHTQAVVKIKSGWCMAIKARD